ncbi:Hypothetical predicted protein [Octopus vulgaris]|uniref:MADF domain-containing protein n=1 Tax=Octopus vulgaris TaxID=6645 RepID=A0AA36BVM5_OCTVU|nr:Hypothetical predicted protein [Octopus vulgaris]
MASMERVDLTMTSSQIELLIELYRERELLWNPDHENYTYRPARAMALREIAEKMGVGWTEDLVKKKWNVLKSAYNRELKRLIELSRISSDVYAPQWWLFQNLDRFLRPHALSRKRAVESHSIEDGSPGPSFERIDDSHDGSMECGEAKERFMRTESARSSCMKPEDMQTICIEPEVIQNIYMEPENIQTLLTEPQEVRNRSIKQESQTNGWRDYSLMRNDGLASGGERFSLSEEVSNSLENRAKKTAFNHCTLMVDQLRNRMDSRTVQLNERRDAEDFYCDMMAIELKSISNEDLKDEAKFEMMRILKDFKKKDRQLKQNALPAPDHI